MSKKIAFVGMLVVLTIMPLIAYGATFKTGQNYYLEPGVVINDNLYTAGGTVGITGTVNGDLFATGGNITVSGPISGDLAAAGGTLNIGSNVLGSVRVAGGSINVSNSVAGDFIAAGGQISLMPGFSVGKDAAIAGGVIYIDGTINGNLLVAGKEIKLGPNTIVKGTFNYYSQNPATLEQGAVVQGATSFHKTSMPAGKPINKGLMAGLIGFFSILKSLMIFVAALVMLYLLKNQVNSIIEKSVSGFWKEALIGFIVLVAIPVAIVLSFITVVGAFLGIIAAISYGLFIAISSVISILLFAKLSLKYIFKKDNYKLNWWVVAIATLAFGLISCIPFVGWIPVFFIFIASLGSTSEFIYKKLKA
jgi:cytoskeletal protein CcmA (bactofilin family)